MPIDTKRLEYLDYLTRWQKCRDVADGAHAVKYKGETYLPKPEGKEQKDYASYKQRAEFYGATGRTIDGLLGAIFRKEPVIEAPESLVPLLLDVTGDGVPLGAFCKVMTNEVLTVGRVGILVDLPPEETTSPHPKFVKYLAEQIINWRATAQGSELVLEQVIIEEKIERPASDSYGVEIVTQWRELALVDGRYTVTVWQLSEAVDGSSEKVWVKKLEAVPKQQGKPLPFIPFWFIGSDRLSPDPAPIPIEDLVELNLGHYQKSADYNTGLYFAGNPTVWAAGFPINSVLSIGAGVAWISENENAKAGYLEFTGQGLEPIAKALKETESRMAVLGARLLEEQKKEAEAAATVILRQSGETSVLKTLALTLSQGLSDALGVFAKWANIDSEVKVMINTEFFAQHLDSNQINSLVAAWQGGAISHDTLLYNFQRFEVLPDGISPDEERQLIELQKPEDPELNEPPEPE